MSGEVTPSTTRGFEDLIEEYSQASLLRLSTAGSVDDGKSTLIGRLLHDTDNIYFDTLESVKEASKMRDVGEIDFSLVTDGLKAEREQGITIDVAYRFFSTPRRKFILADTPGHEQYTRNMATGASNSNVAIVLIDARKGVLTQTKRHSFICSLLGVKHFAIVINKMDLVDFSEEAFESIKADYEKFARKLSGVVDVRFFPTSALLGDNVCLKSDNMDWYSGDTLLNYLENVYVEGDRNYVDLRYPVQYVIRESDKRYYAGQVVSGSVKVGDQVLVLPSGKLTSVKEISGLEGGHSKASAPMSVAISLKDEVDVGRGDMIVHSQNQPHKGANIDSMLVWMSDVPMDAHKKYVLQHTTCLTKATVERVSYRVDVNTLSRTDSTSLGLNEIGRVSLKLQQPIMFDTYGKNRQTGSYILIDPETNNTVAAGMIINRVPSSATKIDVDATGSVSEVVPETDYFSAAARAGKTGHKGMTVWFTGLSGSGKSTIAKEVEKRLFAAGYFCYSLDGDNLRGGLNRDLGFSKQERTENLRRAAEVAKLFNQAGFVVLSAFITPAESDRQAIKKIVGEGEIIDVFVDTPLDVCEKRDVKGLYKRARNGEIPEFTGISAPFDSPADPEIHIETNDSSVDESADLIFNKIVEKLNS